MPKADTGANRAASHNPQRICAGVAGARAVSAHAAFAEHLLAMRMRMHAKQADAEATIL